MQPAPALKSDRISVRLGDFSLLRDVSIEVAPSEMVGLVGPNGCGKTTFLRTIYRTVRPQRGDIYVSGDNVSRLRPRELAQRVAVVGQYQENVESSVEEVVALGRLPYGRLNRDNTRVEDALERFGIAHLRNRRFTTLSGGEKQRALIARGYAQDPELFLLDEPTNHLDIRAQLELLHQVRHLHRAILITLHDLNLAATYCDRIYVMNRGEIVATGAPDRVLTDSLIRSVFGIPAATYRHPITGALQLSFYLPSEESGRPVQH